MNANFVLKVTGAKAADVKKALADAGIAVRSIQEVHKEEPPKQEQEQSQ